MFYDYHVHTNFSFDCSLDMEECINSAISKGVTEMCITDHTDLEFPGLGDAVFDYSKYCSTIENIRCKKGDRIKINRGVELGLQDHLPERLDSFLKGREFDFVIGSIHVVDKKDIVYNEYFNGKSQDGAYGDYFNYLYKCITGFDNFDVLGHLDIIKRYGPFTDKRLEYSKYCEIIDKILKELIYRGKGIEINTSGIRYKLDTYHPSFDILKAYKRLGGEIITTGSDSHKEEHLAYDFKNAYNLLRECGFNHITIFRERKPIQIKI